MIRASTSSGSGSRQWHAAHRGLAGWRESAGLPVEGRESTRTAVWQVENPPAHGRGRAIPRPARSRARQGLADVSAVPVPNARPNKSDTDADVPQGHRGRFWKAKPAPRSEGSSAQDKAGMPRHHSRASSPRPPSAQSRRATKSDLTDDPDVPSNAGGDVRQRADIAEEGGSARSPPPSRSLSGRSLTSKPTPRMPRRSPSSEIAVPAGSKDAPADAEADTADAIDDIPVPTVRPEASGDKADQRRLRTRRCDKAQTKPESAPNSTEKLKSRTATVTPAASVPGGGRRRGRRTLRGGTEEARGRVHRRREHFGRRIAASCGRSTSSGCLRA